MADETMNPGGEGVNPYNSLTRADTFGIRPDLFLRLSEITPSRPEMDELMRKQEENTQKAEEIASDISGVVTKADFSEYDSELQSKLWGDQGEFNKITVEFQKQQKKIDALQNEQIDRLMTVMDEQAAAIEALQEQAVSVSPMMILANGPDWSEKENVWTALGSWRGTVRFTGQYNNDPKIIVRTFAVPREDGSRVYKGSETATYILSAEYQKYPGNQAKRSGSWGYVRDTTPNVYKTLYSTTIGDTDKVFADTTVWLDAAHRGATYQLGVWIDGVKQREFVSSSVGPLGSLGDGHVPIRVQGTFPAKPGSTVEVKYACSYDGAGDIQQRRIRSGSINLSWIDETTA